MRSGLTRASWARACFQLVVIWRSTRRPEALRWTHRAEAKVPRVTTADVGALGRDGRTVGASGASGLR
jgi:hypothetical protein